MPLPVLVCSALEGGGGSRVSVLTLAAAQGRFTAGQDDEMLVKVELKKIPRSDARAAAQLQESISFKAKVVLSPCKT